ncbi:TlpA family protein disulfide reductase [Bradyrhizobium hipponense]|uniref:TlpA family protein disulfide reductase n=1 Tax=Bradyrhizobium hipponense TaxID=2605638 RepID=A0A5S4YVH9_9BRAD|nr:TlpA disulfide reductase family protein [Bradyrhizobium hipponense]TYO67517.1 TlpA family protein disulfide reductase [Bradyrhizobium hipponense]
MLTSRSGPAVVRPNVNLPSRRDFILSILIGTAASLAAPTFAAPQTREIPTFESDKYQFTIVRPQQELPSIRLFRLDGGTVDLSSLRGKPILLNLWASWCAACRTELPILDRQYRGAWRGNLHVAAVSEDRSSRDTVEHFTKTLGLRTLPIYLDPNGYVAHSDSGNSRSAPFALYGMPITYLISSSGLIVGYIPGAADWSSPAANDLIEYLRNN